MRGPVVGGFHVDRVGGLGVSDVADEGLDEGGIDGGSGIVSGEIPKVIDQSAVGPTALLLEHDAGGARSPLFAPENRIGCGGQEKHGAQTPDRVARLGRDEEGLNDVAETEFISQSAQLGALDVDHGKDGPRDEVPIIVEGEWNYRLDVGGELLSGSRADAEVEIALEREADQRADRIGELLGKIGVLRMKRGSDDQRKRKDKGRFHRCERRMR